MVHAAPFSPALFQFLTDLKENNSSEWFQAHKPRFETAVRGPMQRFLQTLAEPLAELNRNILVDPRPVGGSMFRINRDIRFSRDKSPYKTNVGAQFRHQICARDVHSPAFYLHLEPGGCFAGAGSWHPDPEALGKIRTHLAGHPRAWQALAAAGLEVRGETLARVPRGFDPDHPLAAALRLKDFYIMAPLTQEQVCSKDFLALLLEEYRKGLPVMKFLTQALGLAW